MPYRHPVAVTISVLWWGIYLGCFGASLGALLGLWAEQTSAPSQRVNGDGSRPRLHHSAESRQEPANPPPPSVNIVSLGGSLQTEMFNVSGATNVQGTPNGTSTTIDVFGSPTAGSSPVTLGQVDPTTAGSSPFRLKHK
jgi:hypothetical protein